MALDDALEFLGVKGLFPMGIYLMTLYIGICTPWILLIDSFAGYVPQHHCYHENVTNITQFSRWYPIDKDSRDGYSECEIYTSTNGTPNVNVTMECDEFKYYYDASEGESSKISYVPLWDLVCENKIWAKFATTMFFLGNVIGCLIFTSISDRFGRLKVFLYTIWLQGAFGVALAFADSLGGLPMYLIIRCILGALSSGNYNVGFVYMSEMFAPAHRAVVGNVVNVVWSVATAILPGLVLIIPNWQLLVIVISVANFATIPWIFFFPESLPWLLRNNKKKEVQSYLEKVAASRKMILPEGILDEKPKNHDKEVEKKSSQVGDDDDNLKIIALLQHGIVVKCMLIGMGLFFLNSLVYYGMTMSSSDLSEDRHLNFFLSGVAEIPGYLIGMFSTKLFGRRRPMMCLFTIAGTALIIVASLNAALNEVPKAVVMTLIFIGKFGISGTYGIVFLFITEIFPTNTRSIALGMCNVGARLGSIWSPYASFLQERSPEALQFTFGIGALLGVFGTYFLPETHNRSLPNNVNDLKELDAQTKRWRKIKVNVINDKTTLMNSNDDVELDVGLSNPTFDGKGPEGSEQQPTGNGAAKNVDAKETPIYAFAQQTPVQC